MRIEQPCGVGAGRVAIGHYRQRFEIELDCIERIFSACERIGYHHRDDLADVPDAIDRDHRLLERHQIGQRRESQRNRRHLAVRSVGDLACSEHRNHARHRPRLVGPDIANARMRHLAAQHRRVQHAFELDVVDELPCAAQQALVLEA